MIHIVKTPISKKYETLPIMLCNEIGESYEFISLDEAKTSTRYVWHHNSTISPQFSLRPDHNVAMRWDSKIYQYRKLFELINIPDYEVWETSLGLINNLNNIRHKYKEFLITGEYGEGGKSFLYCDEDTTPATIFKKFGMSKLRVSDYISNAESFSVHCIIANETSVYVSPIVKQHIKGKVIFAGGSYPHKTPDGLHEMCEIVAKEMYKDGYLGMFHMDYMIRDGELYFCEVNPRMAATTPLITYTLEQEQNVILPYIEYRSILTGGLPVISEPTGIKLEWDFNIWYGTIPDKKKMIPNSTIREQFKRPEGGYHYIDMFDGRVGEVMVNDL